MFINCLPACPPARLHPCNRSTGLVGVWIALILAGCMSMPDHVAEITVTNSTDHAAMVEVADDDRDSWLGLGRIPPGEEHTFEEVIDFGEQWRFRFVHPEHSEEITVSREQLVDNDWRVEVPARYGERLDELGVEPVDFAD
jgi:hypothetical protein